MAETKTVLVNDGGAPARIINFTAAAAISAGNVLKIDSNGKVAKATTGLSPIAGVAMVDAASGDLCSVITGSGVIVRALTTGTDATGSELMVDTSGTAGQLDDLASYSDGAAESKPVAIALETCNANGLTKVLLL